MSSTIFVIAVPPGAKADVLKGEGDRLETVGLNLA